MGLFRMLQGHSASSTHRSRRSSHRSTGHRSTHRTHGSGTARPRSGTTAQPMFRSRRALPSTQVRQHGRRSEHRSGPAPPHREYRGHRGTRAPTRTNPVRANPVRANPVRANPIRANPVRANPVRAMPRADYVPQTTPRFRETMMYAPPSAMRGAGHVRNMNNPSRFPRFDQTPVYF